MQRRDEHDIHRWIRAKFTTVSMAAISRRARRLGGDVTVLPTATLGRTGVEVTKLGYGAMELRGSGRRWS
jgi:hypothetical protein